MRVPSRGVAVKVKVMWWPDDYQEQVDLKFTAPSTLTLALSSAYLPWIFYQLMSTCPMSNFLYEWVQFPLNSPIYSDSLNDSTDVSTSTCLSSRYNGFRLIHVASWQHLMPTIFLAASWVLYHSNPLTYHCSLFFLRILRDLFGSGLPRFKFLSLLLFERKKSDFS